MSEVVAKYTKADRTRRALLDAALKVIGRKGYSSATVDEIVSEAGVSKGVAYYHFKNKEEIAASILEQEFATLAQEFDSFALSGDAPQQVLLNMLEAFATHLYDRKEVAQFFSAEIWRGGRAWSGGVRTAAQGLIDSVAAQLTRGQELGSIRADLDATFAAASIVGVVVVDAMYCLNEGGTPTMSREEFCEKIFDFAHNAVVA